MNSVYLDEITNKKQDIKNVCFYILFIISCFSFLASFSQEKKPKIGLVLSGGGGKGYAHIGVLKVLEKEGIKIDYIGGTSMGAIVGGLYATGYNASQIDSIFKVTNFNDVLLDQIGRNSKTFYEKHNDELYALILPFDKFKIGLPKGYSKGLYLYNLLNKLTHSVRHVRDFNLLPIPFLCMATDVEKGEQVILNCGSLAQSICASANFPTLYAPMDVDGKWLIDGGVTNNFPVEEIRNLGADIIIGVDVQEGFKDRNSLTDATKILAQITNFQMNEKIIPKKQKTDIYIKPEVSKYGVFSFDKREEIVPIGEEAANLVIDKIKKLSSNYHKEKLSKTNISQDLEIYNININNLESHTRAYVLGKLRISNKEKTSYADIKRGIENLSATQNFSAINYTLEKNNNADDFQLHLTESPNKTYLKIGLHYDGLYKSAVLANITHKKLIFKNDVASLDLGIGDNLRYNFDYYIDNGFYWSFGVKSRFNQFDRNLPLDVNGNNQFNITGINSININFNDFTHQIYAQTLFKQKFIIGGGFELKNIKLDTQTLQAENYDFFKDSSYFSGFGYFKFDSLNNLFFPSKGWYFKGDAKYYALASNKDNFTKYSNIKAEFGFAQNFFKTTTILLQSEAGISIGKNTIPILDYRLGGYGFDKINNFSSFYGYDFLSLTGNSYVKVSGTLDYEIFKKNHINVTANFANIENELFEKPTWIKKPQYTGFAFGYGLETIIGPIELKYSWSPEIKQNFIWASLGFWF